MHKHKRDDGEHDMNKEKKLRKILICVLVIAISTATLGIKIYLRAQDIRWQMTKEIYKIQTALQEVDEDWKLDTLSDVRPFVIKGPNDVVINYYCCITSYLNEEPDETEGLNKTALDLVVDIDSLENKNDCKVGGCEGVRGELEGLTYLCWTVSPKYSCVIEYPTGMISEEDVFHMAESIKTF